MATPAMQKLLELASKAEGSVSHSSGLSNKKKEDSKTNKSSICKNVPVKKKTETPERDSTPTKTSSPSPSEKSKSGRNLNSSSRRQKKTARRNSGRNNDDNNDSVGTTSTGNTSVSGESSMSYRDLEEKLQSMEAENSKLRRRIEQDTNKFNQRVQENAQVKNKELEEKLESVEAENSKLRSLIEQDTNKLNQRVQENAPLKNKELEEKLQSVEADFSKLRSRVEQDTSKLNQRLQQNSQLKNQVEILDETIVSSELEREETSQRIKHLQAELEAATRNAAELAVKLADQRTVNQMLALRMKKAEGVNKAQQALNEEMAVRMMKAERISNAENLKKGSVVSYVTGAANDAAAAAAFQVQEVAAMIVFQAQTIASKLKLPCQNKRKARTHSNMCKVAVAGNDDGEDCSLSTDSSCAAKKSKGTKYDIIHQSDVAAKNPIQDMVNRLLSMSRGLMQASLKSRRH